MAETTATETVIKWWIIVHEPGKVPEKKTPWPQTDDGAADFLISLALCRPAGTRYTLACLTWDHDLWVSEGAEELSILRLDGPRRFAKRVHAVAERESSWLTTTPDRIRLVASGHMP